MGAAEGQFPKVDGDILYASEINSFFNNESINKLIQENSLNILINGAASSSTLNDYDDMYLELFTDTTGYSNTVDTGNTTAGFGISAYYNTNISNIYEGYTDTCNVLVADPFSLAFTSDTINNEHVVNAKCEMTNNSTAAQRYKFYAKFFYSDLTNATGTTQEIYNNNQNIKPTLTSTNPYPYKEVILIEYYGGKDYSSNTYLSSPIANFATEENLLIQTNAETIIIDPTHHQVYCHNTIVGSGTIDYDISFDGGNTWDTNQELNIKNTTGGSNTGSEMKIKLNLNGTGTGNTVTADDYAIMLFY